MYCIYLYVLCFYVTGICWVHLRQHHHKYGNNALCCRVMTMTEVSGIAWCYLMTPPQYVQPPPVTKRHVVRDCDSHRECAKCSPRCLPNAFLELWTLLTPRIPGVSIQISFPFNLPSDWPSGSYPTQEQQPFTQPRTQANLKCKFQQPLCIARLVPSLLTSPLFTKSAHHALLGLPSHLSPGRRPDHVWSLPGGAPSSRNRSDCLSINGWEEAVHPLFHGYLCTRRCGSSASELI